MKGIKYAGGTLEKLPTGVYRISTVQDGKQVQKRFKTKLDAERFLESVRDGRKALTVAQIADAQAAFNVLEKAGCSKSLLEVINEWMGTARTTLLDINEALREYLGDIEGTVSDKTYDRYRSSLSLFARETPMEVHRIGVDEIKTFISNHCSKDKPESILTTRVTIGTFLNWCKKRKYLQDNPVDLIRPVRTKDHRIEFYTVEEAKRIIQQGLKDDPAMVPYLILGLFAGLRPIERERMNVGINAVTDPKDPDGRWYALNITGDVAKGGGHERRFIELSEQCRSMLLYWESEFGMLQTSVIPCAPVTAARRAKDIIRKAIGKYIKDGERHTFATHHFAAFGDSARTASFCGHSETVALNHYRGRIGMRDGKTYLGIRPEECGLRNFAGDIGELQIQERRSIDVPYRQIKEGWLGSMWDGTSDEFVEVRVKDYLDNL